MKKSIKNTKKMKRNISDENPSAASRFIDGIIILSSLIVAIITALLSILGAFDVFQTVATTMLSFLCAEYIGHSFIVKSRYFSAKKNYSLVEQANDWTGKLYEMNEYCKSIIENSHGSQDLFITSCKKNIDNLHYVLQLAARDEKIEISSDYIVNSDGVFDALNVSDEKVVELTFPIDQLKDGILRTAEDKKFFETAYKMVQLGVVKMIKVLLILGDDDFIHDYRLKALCKFYDTNQGFEGKYISKADFAKACESNMISSSQIDFGIYGPRMMFKVESYEPYKGIYTKNEAEVHRYRKLFDEMWNFASLTHDLPETGVSNEPVEPMGVIKLFNELSQGDLSGNPETDCLQSKQENKEGNLQKQCTDEKSVIDVSNVIENEKNPETERVKEIDENEEQPREVSGNTDG